MYLSIVNGTFETWSQQWAADYINQWLHFTVFRLNWANRYSEHVVVTFATVTFTDAGWTGNAEFFEVQTNHANVWKIENKTIFLSFFKVIERWKRIVNLRSDFNRLILRLTKCWSNKKNSFCRLLNAIIFFQFSGLICC